MCFGAACQSLKNNARTRVQAPFELRGVKVEETCNQSRLCLAWSVAFSCSLVAVARPMTALPMLVLPLWRACMTVCGAPMGIQCGAFGCMWRNDIACHHRGRPPAIIIERGLPSPGPSYWYGRRVAAAFQNKQAEAVAAFVHLQLNHTLEFLAASHPVALVLRYLTVIIM